MEKFLLVLPITYILYYILVYFEVSKEIKKRDKESLLTVGVRNTKNTIFNKTVSISNQKKIGFFTVILFLILGFLSTFSFFINIGILISLIAILYAYYLETFTKKNNINGSYNFSKDDLVFLNHLSSLIVASHYTTSIKDILRRVYRLTPNKRIRKLISQMESEAQRYYDEEAFKILLNYYKNDISVTTLYKSWQIMRKNTSQLSIINELKRSNERLARFFDEKTEFIEIKTQVWLYVSFALICILVSVPYIIQALEGVRHFQ